MSQFRHLRYLATSDDRHIVLRKCQTPLFQLSTELLGSSGSCTQATQEHLAPKYFLTDVLNAAQQSFHIVARESPSSNGQNSRGGVRYREKTCLGTLLQVSECRESSLTTNQTFISATTIVVISTGLGLEAASYKGDKRQQWHQTREKILHTNCDGYRSGKTTQSPLKA
ncbi:hypothetical protein BDZ89DRAFT_1049792 [Hymenopellis radicata]|nr:hypothetical protein BDZ89DRAFT_1049792 [Hymenopellis radicata]